MTVLRHRSFAVGAALTLALLIAAALSLAWTPWPPYEIDMDAALQPPAPAIGWARTPMAAT